ncbi:7-dehydrocholesterol reductase [Streptomyces mashuensis]|uniref:7-dehydrocholesterol reductase n=1 Tax=Streptomyces mashuensis TaxID=33904 RepID=A0A919B6C8_9ACTN|nr:7-dehydrocholesterol reductase [Streptomyces mashuensis]GHF53286.1 7-dehydrocholesterol reductase [Streptomyces mashuensis]
MAPRASVLRCTVGPLALLLVTPPVVLLLWTLVAAFDGALRPLLAPAQWPALVAALPRPTLRAAFTIAGFVAFEAALLRLLPGPRRYGPVTPAGVRPVYRANGPAALAVTHAAYLAASLGLGWFPPGILYDRSGELLATACVLAWALSAALYVKGLRRPSGPDHGTTGHRVLDLFWGTELHPTLGGIDLKQLFNCRVGMMSWGLLLVSCAAAQHERTHGISSSMAVATGLQLAYIVKFFVWETGYFATLDVMHDRFGYYLCWGVTVWLPGIYPLSTLYLVAHPRHLPPWETVLLLTTGLTALAVNYSADEQRQRVRRTGGATRIWGRPAKTLRARYSTGDGTEHTTVLLHSGWWGLSRHFHYLPEVVLAVCWAAPAGSARVLPWFYPVYLAVLLADRTGRDERRCLAKYGDAYRDYCRRVRWKVIPYLY